MPILSTQQLRMVFKSNIDELLQQTKQSQDMELILPQIQHLSERLEKVISQKVQMLEQDFHDYHLTGEYLRTVTESFDDLERLMRSSETFADLLQQKERNDILRHIKIHYTQVLVPLLNIMSKLENDYVSLATQCIFKKQENLNKVQGNLRQLRTLQQEIENSLFVFGKNKKLKELNDKILNLDLERKFLQLTAHQDRLNLYYFNHEHPEELREIKIKADELKTKLIKQREDYLNEKE